MKDIILTGYGREEYLKKKNVKPRCYLCKREAGDEGLFIATEGTEEGFGTIELAFEWFEITKSNKKFRFPICHECQLLLETISERIRFCQRFSTISKN